jgi:hypothetical protein
VNTSGHYAVDRYGEAFALRGEIRSLSCGYCPFRVVPRNFHRRGDKSGLGRYNRARAVIVRHLHEKHAEQLRGVA